MTALDALFAAHEQRQAVRDLIVKELRRLPNLPADLIALLSADNVASAELREALASYEPIGVSVNGSATVEL